MSRLSTFARSIILLSIVLTATFTFYFLHSVNEFFKWAKSESSDTGINELREWTESNITCTGTKKFPLQYSRYSKKVEGRERLHQLYHSLGLYEVCEIDTDYLTCLSEEGRSRDEVYFSKLQATNILLMTFELASSLSMTTITRNSSWFFRNEFVAQLGLMFNIPTYCSQNFGCAADPLAASSPADTALLVAKVESKRKELICLVKSTQSKELESLDASAVHSVNDKTCGALKTIVNSKRSGELSSLLTST